MLKNPPASAGDIKDAGSIPGLGRSPGGGHGSPLHIPAWRIPWTEEPGRQQSMGVAESRTQLSDLAQSASGVSIHTGAGRLSHEGLSPLLWISSPGWHARPKPKQACHSIGSILH